jgi:hypothetical protein
MASFEEEFYLENPTRWQVVQRDMRLLWLLARYAVMWLTRGVIVRKAYRRARLSGEPLEIEAIIED